MKYFIADTHFDHRKIAKIRGFFSSKEHDRCLLEGINSVVTRSDHLFILGDFARDHVQKYRQEIWCRHIRFIRGNHDKFAQVERAFGQTSAIAKTHLRGPLDQKLPCVLCHYPMAFWNLSHHGGAHLYGHCHGLYEDRLYAAFPKRRSMDVGVDNLKRRFNVFAPVSEVALYILLSQFEGHDQKNS